MKSLDLYYINPKFWGNSRGFQTGSQSISYQKFGFIRKLKSFIMDMIRAIPTKKGWNCWLDEDQLKNFINCANGASKRKDMVEKLTIAVTLGGRAGLRASEITKARDADKKDNNATLNIPEGKGGKFRTVPLPQSIRLLKFDDYLINPSTGRGVTVTTIENWIEMIGKEYHERYDDENALKVTPHDLRRSWGNNLAEMDPPVDADMIMKWGGWSSRPVFDKHYLNVGSPKYEKKQRERLPWL